MLKLPTRVLAGCLLLLTGTVSAQFTPDAEQARRQAALPALTSTPPRSILFDARSAEEARRRQQAVFVESITVVGRDPDRRPVRRESFETRFANALLAPSPASAAGIRPLDATPCYAVQSSLNPIGNSYAPLTGCPR